MSCELFTSPCRLCFHIFALVSHCVSIQEWNPSWWYRIWVRLNSRFWTKCTSIIRSLALCLLFYVYKHFRLPRSQYCKSLLSRSLLIIHASLDFMCYSDSFTVTNEGLAKLWGCGGSFHELQLFITIYLSLLPIVFYSHLTPCHLFSYTFRNCCSLYLYKYMPKGVPDTVDFKILSWIKTAKGKSSNAKRM